MKILWVVNTIFPDAAAHLGMKEPVVGGWMYGLASDLAGEEGLQLAVAALHPGREFLCFEVRGIVYYLIPQKGRAQALEIFWKKICADFEPDLVHIHGTEYSHGMALMELMPDLKYVISIQGLVSVCYRYFLAGMSAWDVLSNITFRDLVRMDSLFQAKRSFYRRGLVEREYVRRATAVIGRTDWDYAHAVAINPRAVYFHCDESLRDEFYKGETWNIEKCTRYSIFLSQGSYPIKGLHQVLKAVALLKRDYPSIMVEVAGIDITRSVTWMDRLRMGGYGHYIASLIRELHLEQNVKFVGQLQAEDMKKSYLRSHLFICPSSIENSPNSLGEAQMLGLCSIASYCGGVPSMVKNGSTAILYPFGEYELLAQIIRQCFEDDQRVKSIAAAGRTEAQLRHSRSRNLAAILTIYSGVIES